MMNTPLSANRQLLRYLLAGPLVAVAALGYVAAHTHQTAPTGAAAPGRLAATQPERSAASPAAAPHQLRPARPLAATPATTPPPSRSTSAAGRQAGPKPMYYVNGKLATEASVKKLDVAAIADVKVLKGEAARQLAGAAGANGMVLITTKANQPSPTLAEVSQHLNALDYAPSSSPATSFLLPPDALYYLNGQPSTKQVIEQLNLDEIASTTICQNAPAQWQRVPALRDSKAPAAILVTTKAATATPTNPAPRADAAADEYTIRPLEVNALLPKTLVYITSHYPDSRLNEVTELTLKATGAVKYRVQLITGRRPFYVYFSPQGEFLGE